MDPTKNSTMAGTFILVNINGENAECTVTYVLPKVTKYELQLLESLENMHDEELGRKEQRDNAYHYVSSAIGYYASDEINFLLEDCMIGDLCIKALNKWSEYKVKTSADVNELIRGKPINGIFYINHVLV